VRTTPFETYKGILEKSPYLSIPITKVKAGFGFSAGLGVGVGSGVETGRGADFFTRLPDCATAATAHDNNTMAHRTA